MHLLHIYIYLSYLTDALLGFVDDKKIPIRAGVELSFLNEKEQTWVEEILDDNGRTVAPAQAEKIREYSESKELTRAMVELILTEKVPKPRRFVLKEDRLFEFFSKDTPDEEIEDTIIGLLKEWSSKNNR